MSNPIAVYTKLDPKNNNNNNNNFENLRFLVDKINIFLNQKFEIQVELQGN